MPSEAPNLFIECSIRVEFSSLGGFLIEGLGKSWRIEGLVWSPISVESVYRLDSLFTEEDICKAIFQLDRDKVPRPDSFTIALFQECWDVIKEDLVRLFAKFHRSETINQSTNVTFVALVPKKSFKLYTY